VYHSFLEDDGAKITKKQLYTNNMLCKQKKDCSLQKEQSFSIT